MYKRQLYYLTKPRSGQQGEGKTFSSSQEVIIAFDQGQIKVHTKINVRVTYLNEHGNEVTEVVKTSTGRVLFNEIVPTERNGFHQQDSW